MVDAMRGGTPPARTGPFVKGHAVGAPPAPCSIPWTPYGRPLRFAPGQEGLRGEAQQAGLALIHRPPLLRP